MKIFETNEERSDEYFIDDGGLPGEAGVKGVVVHDTNSDN